MINDLLFMNSYGVYVWSAFAFTLVSFGSLFFMIRLQLIKEQKRFISKFGLLDEKKLRFAKLGNINKEILLSTLNSKI